MATNNKQSTIILGGESKQHEKLTINSSNIRDVTLKEFLQFWFYDIHQYLVGPTTRTIAEHALNKYILPNVDDFTRVCLINGKYIDEIIANVRKTVGDVGENNKSSIPELVYRVLFSAFRYADATKLLQNNPMQEATRVYRPAPKDIKPLNFTEIEKLLSVTRDFKESYAEILLALFNGLRRGEIYGLEEDDFDFVNKTVHIRCQRIVERHLDADGNFHNIAVKKPPKTVCSNRLLKVDDYVLKAVQERLDINARNKKRFSGTYQDSKVVFCNRYGQPFYGPQLNSAITKACIRAGIEKRSCHALRHTFATMLLEQGEDLKTISRLLGHANESTTFSVYCSVIEGGKQISDAINNAYSSSVNLMLYNDMEVVV